MTSDLQDSVTLISGEAGLDSYLYEARDVSQPIFHGIQEDFEQLNDYCFLCIDETANKLQGIRREAQALRSGQETVKHEDFGDITNDVVWSLEDSEIPRWEDTEQFLVKAMCLILLSAFLEKSLKEIVKYLAPENAEKFRTQRGKGDVASLLAYLREVCLLNYEEPESSRLTRERCRKIRNDFAHGRWNEVKNEVSVQSLRAAFLSVTELLQSIDQAGEIDS